MRFNYDITVMLACLASLIVNMALLLISKRILKDATKCTNEIIDNGNKVKAEIDDKINELKEIHDNLNEIEDKLKKL